MKSIVDMDLEKLSHENGIMYKYIFCTYKKVNNRITKLISKRCKSYTLIKTCFVFCITFYLLIFITPSYARQKDWQCGYITGISINEKNEFKFSAYFTSTNNQPNGFIFLTDNVDIINLVKMAYFTRSSTCISWWYYANYWYIYTIKIPSSK